MKKFLQAMITDLLNDWTITDIVIDTDYTDEDGCMFTVVYRDGSEKEGFLSTSGRVHIG